MGKKYSQKKTQTSSIDPITMEIIRYGLNSIPNRIDINLTRTAFSPMVYEYKDYSVGIVDPEGNLISHCKGGIPIFVANAVGVAVRDGLEIYGRDRIKQGDVIISNHGDTLGQHLNNVVMYTPVYTGRPGDEELVAFMSVVVHWMDIGGNVWGSCLSNRTTEIFQEGIQFRTVKLWSEGQPVEEIYRMIEYNTRIPEMVLGDLEAQLGGCLIGRDMIIELINKYGIDAVRATIELNWDQSEQIARQAIREIPDGEYRASSFLDNDGISLNQPINIEVAVRVERDEITIDYSGVSPQCFGPLNAGINGGAIAAARVACKYLLTPDEPANEGDFRPLKVVIPKGTLLSAGHNAPLGHSGSMLPTVVDTIIKAMGQAIPDRIAAAHHGTYGIHVFVGINPDTGQLFYYGASSIGGWGATCNQDGTGPSRSLVHGDTLEVPAEFQEACYPLRLDSFSLRTDSGGAGEFRGGLGIEKVYTVLSQCSATIGFERTKCPPWGLWGGKEAETGYVEVHRTDGSVERVLKQELILQKGDRVIIRTGGGGGFGPPYSRNPLSVAADVAHGYVSKERALTDYGVALDEDLSVIAAETVEARRRIFAKSTINNEGPNMDGKER